MAWKEVEVSTPLLENIENQPKALAVVRQRFCSEGGSSLQRIARLLQEKDRIVVSGMGASLFASGAFAYGLSQRQEQANSLDAGELLYYLSGQVDRNSAVILVSRSGESVEVLKAIPDLRKCGATIIGVVNVPGSSLEAEADETLVLGCPADQMVAIQTYSATAVAFALLNAALAGDLGDALRDLDQAVEVIARYVPYCVASSESWRPFFEAAAPLYLLGRGSSFASSIPEGVLLMHETAKAPAIGMSSAQFRHGPVEVVDERFRGLIISTQNETRHLEEALAADLSHMGAQVRWIGPAPFAKEVQSLCDWPANLPPRFAFLGEIVPLQVAAYRKAELNGVRPGEFRWAPLVTTSETGFSMPDRAR